MTTQIQTTTIREHFQNWLTEQQRKPPILLIVQSAELAEQWKLLNYFTKHNMLDLPVNTLENFVLN